MADVTLFQSTNRASGEFQSGIGAATVTINLKAGEGAEFPQPITGSATSGGTSTTLNSTGIQAAGVAVGDFIRNITDGSYAFVRTVSTNSVTTSILRGGSGNTWDNSDEWRVKEFVISANTKDSDGVITAIELIRIEDRSTDVLTVATGGRGFGNTLAQTWNADDDIELFDISEHNTELIKLLGDLEDVVAAKADLSAVNTLLDGRNWKDSVRVATTAAGTLTTDFEDGDTIDAIVLVTGDRILIKDQASAVENGIYTVNASGSPTRAVDFDEDSEVVSAVTFAEEGTANSDSMWICTNDEPVTIGVTNITFVQFTSALNAIPESIVTAIGSMITATAASTPSELLAGANRQRIIYDDIEANGIRTTFDEQYLFDSNTWIRTNVGAGTLTESGYSNRLATGATSNDYENRNILLPPDDGSNAQFFQYATPSNGDVVDVVMRFKLSSTSNIDWVFGIQDNGSLGVQNKDAGPLKAIFKFTSGTLESSTSDSGSTEEDQSIAGITMTNWNTFRVRWLKGTDVQFFINGVLENTHTTNIPGNFSNTLAIVFGVRATSASSRNVDFDSVMNFRYNRSL